MSLVFQSDLEVEMSDFTGKSANFHIVAKPTRTLGHPG
jgi:hypothetical protein